MAYNNKWAAQEDSSADYQGVKYHKSMQPCLTWKLLLNLHSEISPLMPHYLGPQPSNPCYDHDRRNDVRTLHTFQKKCIFANNQRSLILLWLNQIHSDILRKNLSFIQYLLIPVSVSPCSACVTHWSRGIPAPHTHDSNEPLFIRPDGDATVWLSLCPHVCGYSYTDSAFCKWFGLSCTHKQIFRPLILMYIKNNRATGLALTLWQLFFLN